MAAMRWSTEHETPERPFLVRRLHLDLMRVQGYCCPDAF